jgi:UDP-N-acetylglucosamine acyltransferase
MSHIHPTAIVDSRAELADDVEIRPYAIIEGHVVLGAGTVVFSHSVVQGHAVIGTGCKIGPGAYVGLPPQHLANAGVGTSTYIGDGAIIRETAQVHRSTKAGLEFATRVGARAFVMAGAHVAHDCVVGDDVIMANAVLLGGHCVIGNRAFLGGGATIHQFVRIGRLAIICGNEVVTRDVPPFAAARYGGLKGYNAIGCKRAGMSRESISAIRAAFRCFHTHRTTPAAMAAIERAVPLVDEVKEMLAFVAVQSKRGLQPSVRFVSSPDPFGDAE